MNMIYLLGASFVAMTFLAITFFAIKIKRSDLFLLIKIVATRRANERDEARGYAEHFLLN